MNINVLQITFCRYMYIVHVHVLAFLVIYVLHKVHVYSAIARLEAFLKTCVDDAHVRYIIAQINHYAYCSMFRLLISIELSKC